MNVSRCSTGFISGLREGHFCILSYYPIGGLDDAPQCFDSPQISLYSSQIQDTLSQLRQTAPGHNQASSMFRPHLRRSATVLWTLNF